MKVGLVLSGGGGKGAYEIGVWEAIKELNIDKYIKVVSGTSIGAINAALFAQDDFEEAKKMWKEVTIEKLLPINNRGLIRKGITLTIGSKNMNLVKKYMSKQMEQGDVPRDGAKDIIEKYINIDKLKRLQKICYVSCTEMPEFSAKYFRVNDYEEEKAKSILLATACLPMIYESEEIEGKTYLDGGLVDNTPIKPVYEEGCDIIIAVLLSKEAKIRREDFPNAKIIEIIPSDIEIRVLDGLLNLDEESKNKRIQRGYNDTKNLLEPIFEMARYQYKEELERWSMEKKDEEKNRENWLIRNTRKIKDRILSK
ncbi:patatin-like phospholipase family protein [Clostridium sp. UBA1056]|uniref:patatin-like phospholipase family protein n=1 Tax=unclassified Clostridium TaxID=2614128 RepID=UPI0032171550